MKTVLAMLTVQCLLGAFDNLWHHEITEKLPQKPGARHELALHTARELLYALIFTSIAWMRWQGVWAFVFIGILLLEITVTLCDFVVEDRTRRLPPLERVLHTVLAINFGATLAVWWPELRGWVVAPTGLAVAGYGSWSWLMTAFGAGVFVWGLRDLAAVVRLGVPEWQRHPVRARQLAAPRTILVTGATGFIGCALTRKLIRRGDRVIVLTRDPAKARDRFGPMVEIRECLDLIEAKRRIDAVVNLAGEPLTGGLWTRSRKGRFVESRLGVTAAIRDLVIRLERKPEVMITGSAIGYYGDRGDELLTEDSGARPIFMSDLCRDWEAAASEVERQGMRVCRLRIGLVLGAGGGALQPMVFATRLCLGAVLGSGRQYLSWIHLRDLVRLILFAIEEPALKGPVNAVAPEALPHRDFMHALAAALHRPLFLCFPRGILRAVLGELSDLFLTSQRVVPRAATASGFWFEFGDLRRAFAEIGAPPPGPAAPLSIYFNRGCGVCRGEMAHYQAESTRADREIEFKSIDVCAGDLAAWGVDAGDLRRRFYLVDREGTMLSGVDAFIALWRELPRYRWAAYLAGLPGVYRFCQLVYEGICVPLLALLNRQVRPAPGSPGVVRRGGSAITGLLFGLVAAACALPCGSSAADSLYFDHASRDLENYRTKDENLWLRMSESGDRVVALYGRPDRPLLPQPEKFLDLQVSHRHQTHTLLIPMTPMEAFGHPVLASGRVEFASAVLSARYDDGFFADSGGGWLHNTSRRLLPNAQAAWWSILYAKSLIGAAPPWDLVVGHDLELVPQADPREIATGGRLRVLLLFHGQPLAGATIACSDGLTPVRQRDLLRVKTGADGVAEITIDRAGGFLLASQYLAKPSDTPKLADGDLFHATLYFAVGDAR